jgi:hypothetical protein
MLAALPQMSRSELEATVVSQTKVMERFRNKLGSIVLGIEDEGDRAYFGSTNDADELRELEGNMLDSLNILECPWMHGRDLHAELAELRSQNTELLQAAQRALNYIANTEGELGITLESGDMLRAAIAKASPQQPIQRKDG